MKSLGLALGGGSARGWAHVGVLKALEEADIPIHSIAGTSIGALVGGIFAGSDLQTLINVVDRITWKRVLQHLDVTNPLHGLMSGKNIEALIDRLLGVKTFADLPIPFAAVAVDLHRSEEVIITEGELVSAMRASISLPGIFSPHEWEGRFLVDGGVLNPLPVNAVRAFKPDVVLAVDLNFYNPPISDEAVKKPLVFQTLAQSTNLMQAQITEKNLVEFPADLLLRPDLGNIDPTDFHNGHDMIEEGYQCMQKALPELLNLLKEN